MTLLHVVRTDCASSHMKLVGLCLYQNSVGTRANGLVQALSSLQGYPGHLVQQSGGPITGTGWYWFFSKIYLNGSYANTQLYYMYAQCLKGFHVNAQLYNTQCPVVLCSMPSFSFAEKVKAFVENKSGKQEMRKQHGLT